MTLSRLTEVMNLDNSLVVLVCSEPPRLRRVLVEFRDGKENERDTRASVVGASALLK